jgi:outer membrane receptor for ferrienterochelin and colicin
LQHLLDSNCFAASRIINLHAGDLAAGLGSLKKELDMKNYCKWILGILLLNTIFHTVALSATDSATLKGQIIEKKSSKTLAGVNVSVLGTGLGASTDINGWFFVDQLTAGTYSLKISFVGYEDLLLENLQLEADQVKDLGSIALIERPISLREVVVTPSSFSIMGEQPVSRQTMTSEDIKMMSYSEDITRAVSRLPGVASSDFSSKFTVRGGEADEVLMTLDGMELYEPFHQRDFSGGLFSIVDIEAVESIELQTGGFSADYGNRQSAVFNMNTKRPKNGKKRTALGLSLTTAGLYTEGPFANDKGNYLFSFRRGILDKIFALAGYDENVPIFYDMLGKAEYRLNSKHSIAGHILLSRDETQVRDVAPEAHDIHNTKYDSNYGWLTLNSIYNDNIHSKTLLFGGNIDHDRNGNTDKYEYSDKLYFQLSDKRSNNFYGIKQDWGFDLGDKIYLKSGYDIRQMNADYDYTYELNDIRVNADGIVGPYVNSVDIHTKPEGKQIGVYVNARVRLMQKLIMESGLRYDNSTYSDDQLISPRVSLAYSLAENTFLRGAWGHYYQSQFINNLNVNHGITEFREAELSEHFVLGVEHLLSNGISLRLDTYNKSISQLSPGYNNLRDPWEVFPEARNDLVRLNINEARSRGVELFLKYDQGKKISWWFSYALAKAEEKIDSIDYSGLLNHQTGWLPRINNQTHTVYADVNYRPNDKWHFNFSWQYYIGLPQTVYEYQDTVLPNDSLHFYPEHKVFRDKQFPAYHRMDIRVNRYYKLKNSRLSAYLHVINIYNRENQRKFDLDVTNDSENLVPLEGGGFQYFRDDALWFGILPVIGISWEF